MAKSYKPSVQRIPISRAGRIDSDKLSSFVGGTVDDILGLSEFVTELSSRQEEAEKVTAAVDRDLRQRCLQLSAEVEALRLQAAKDSQELVYSLTFFDSSKVTFHPDASITTRAMVDTVFGEATVPLNAAEARFFQEAIGTGSLLPISDLSVQVTGTFDAGDDQGVVDHEAGGTVEVGEPLRAFNGNNVSRWFRKVSFPLYSDVNEVLCEVTVTVPEGAGGYSNCLYILPFPSGDVDVLGAYLSPDLGTSFSMVPGFVQVNGCGPKRWLFPASPVQRVKYRLRQRNWVEEDGRKVFYYGAQEFGLQLLDFDKTWNVVNPVEQNHTVVLFQSAPDGYVFNTLTGLWTDPMFSLEDSGLRHIHVRVATDAEATNVVWDSDLDSLPQSGAGVALGGAFKTLYFFVTLNWVATSGGAGSPFSVGTTPIVRGLRFNAETAEE